MKLGLPLDLKINWKKNIWKKLQLPRSIIMSYCFRFKENQI